MAYEQKISRTRPGLIVFTLDESLSMRDKLAGTQDARCHWVSLLFGVILRELLSRSTEDRGGNVCIKPRYYVYVVLYGSSIKIWGNGLMDIEAAVEAYTKAGNSLGLGGHLGGTDAETAFGHALTTLRQAMADERFNESFPPMLFHLTDGESQTDAQPIAEQIKQLATSDGNVLAVNAYIGTQTNLGYQGPEDFPGYVDVNDVGTTPDNLRLFEMSSVMPATIHQNLTADGVFPKLRTGSRLFFDVRTKFDFRTF